MRLTIDIPDHLVSLEQVKAMQAGRAGFLIIELRDGNGLVFSCDVEPPKLRTYFLNLVARRSSGGAEARLVNLAAKTVEVSDGEA